jgi:hypothetical protein
MKKGTAIILAGIMVLFLVSLYAGQKIFSAYERDLSVSGYDKPVNESPEAALAAKKRANFRKARLAFSSFDLLAGFTNKELENIPTYSLAFPFFYLLACFWLILGLRKPKREQ